MDIQQFLQLIETVLGVGRAPNARQQSCLLSELNPPTLIVAGPGTGKTSVLVLRALRHVLVDRMAPEAILITTFTVKAAKEIRTRLLEWGEPMIDHLRSAPPGSFDHDFAAFLETVDVNRFLTGTLDGVCQEALGEQRAPGERRFVVVEGFAADVLLSRVGEVAQECADVAELKPYLAQYTLFGEEPRNTGEAVRVVRTLIDRFIQDDVDVAAYVAAPGPFPAAREAIKRINDRYAERLLSAHQMDFSVLERTFLDRLIAGQTPDMVASIQALLVDEYQDTNPLQERLYLELALRTGAALTVVGDDDQSLYRFRGATIELFRAFPQRVNEVLSSALPTPHYLVENYRSSPEIVDFYNAFILNDPDFGPARIQPPKPAIVATQASQSMPVLGLFRDNPDQLATAIADLLELIFRQHGRPADAQLSEPILASTAGGDLGDAVFLGPTVAEITSADRLRLPSLLRDELESRNLFVFNPRGRALRDVPEVRELLGLVLLCLEPSAPALSIDGSAGQMRLTGEALRAMQGWRNAAQALIDSNPPPVRGRPLQATLNRWRSFALSGSGSVTEWPLLDVFYSFIPWLPGFRDDPEGQVYLEAISRCAAQASTFSGYRGLILRDQPHRERSIWLAVRDVMAPIAQDLVEVDEEIMPSVPRDRLNIMTVHQAKGLEFPLVIVDVGSDYKTNHAKQKFRRFPDEPSPAARLENDLAPFTTIGPTRLARTDMQRTFEDIIRLNYVAYSRPQSLLVLVGLRPNLRYGTTIKNVATFWRRDETWGWRTPSTPAPVLANNLPIQLI